MKVMARRFRKYFSIFLQMQKIGIMNRMAYPVNFFIMVFAVGVVMILDVFFMGAVFQFFPSVAGWNLHQTLIVVGAYMIVEGMMWGLFAQLNIIDRHIKDGTMDAIIVKPIDTQFFVSVWRSDPEDLTRIISGIAVIWYSVLQLGITGWLLVSRLFLFMIFVIMAFLIMYSLNLIIRCASFKTIEGYGLWSIIESITRMTQYPTDIFYTKAVRSVITFVVPLAFIATVPAKILSRDFDWALLLQAILITIIFFVGSRKLWNFSLKHYSSASS